MKKAVTLILSMLLVFSLANPALAATSTTFTDNATNNQLTVPAGWEVEYADGSLMNVKFIPSSGSALMQYGSGDLWSELSSSEKRATPRAEMDNSCYSLAGVAKLVGCKTSEVKRVTIGGLEYYQAAFAKSTTYSGYKISIDTTYWIRVYNGWIYLYCYIGSQSSSLYTSFKDMVASATYGEKQKDTKEETYQQAIKYYNEGAYGAADEYFGGLTGYKDADKYLRLIRIRRAGWNIGMGSDVYLKSCSLSNQDKKDIDAAAKDFYFADTAEVLLCNSDVACYYLQGKWDGGAYCYISFTPNDKGGWGYTIGSKLSTNYKSTFSIEDGEVRVDVLNTNKLTMKLTLTGRNTLKVLTYEKGNKTYTLTRN